MALTILDVFPVIWGILMSSGVSGSYTVEDDGLEGVTNYHVILGVVLFICFIAALALCAPRELPSPPPWHQAIQTDPKIDIGFTSYSDGITIVSRNCIQRHRTGNDVTDGARWGTPLSTGKHIFEIYWPRDHRSYFATVGVGSEGAELFVKPRYSLVGKDKLSWGFDLARRQLVHNARAASFLPGWYMPHRYVPDKLYMYVDCDTGALGFGADSDYWGSPQIIPRESFPVYPMVGVMCPGAQVTMTYRGSTAA